MAENRLHEAVHATAQFSCLEPQKSYQQCSIIFFRWRRCVQPCPCQQPFRGRHLWWIKWSSSKVKQGLLSHQAQSSWAHLTNKRWPEFIQLANPKTGRHHDTTINQLPGPHNNQNDHSANQSTPPNNNQTEHFSLQEHEMQKQHKKREQHTKKTIDQSNDWSF